jgi:hypothetical protein
VGRTLLSAAVVVAVVPCFSDRHSERKKPGRPRLPVVRIPRMTKEPASAADGPRDAGRNRGPSTPAPPDVGRNVEERPFKGGVTKRKKENNPTLPKAVAPERRAKIAGNRNHHPPRTSVLRLSFRRASRARQQESASVPTPIRPRAITPGKGTTSSRAKSARQRGTGFQPLRAKPSANLYSEQ